MANLITPSRAKQNIKDSDKDSFGVLQENAVTSLIAACSQNIIYFCGRDFVSASYDELYSPDSYGPYLWLKQAPLTVISRVSYNLQQAISIKNTSWPTNVRATAKLTSTTLELTRVASGSSSTSTLTLASYTFTTLVDAIDAVGSGWDAALVDSNMAGFPATDLKVPITPQGCANSNASYLYVHVDDATDYDINFNRGELIRSCGWPQGPHAVRVVYTAGWSTVPEDVQEACATMVAALYYQYSRDPGLSLQKTADLTYQANPIFEARGQENVRRLLAPYIRQWV